MADKYVKSPTIDDTEFKIKQDTILYPLDWKTKQILNTDKF